MLKPINNFYATLVKRLNENSFRRAMYMMVFLMIYIQTVMQVTRAYRADEMSNGIVFISAIMLFHFVMFSYHDIKWYYDKRKSPIRVMLPYEEFRHQVLYGAALASEYSVRCVQGDTLNLPDATIATLVSYQDSLIHSIVNNPDEGKVLQRTIVDLFEYEKRLKKEKGIGECFTTYVTSPILEFPRGDEVIRLSLSLVNGGLIIRRIARFNPVDFD